MPRVPTPTIATPRRSLALRCARIAGAAASEEAPERRLLREKRLAESISITQGDISAQSGPLQKSRRRKRQYALQDHLRVTRGTFGQRSFVALPADHCP